MTNLVKAAHALDGIPVTAFHDGTEHETTLAKAIGMGDTAKQARNEWAEVARKLEKELPEHDDVDKATRQQAFEHLAAFNPIRNFDRMVKSFERERAIKGRADRIVRLAKAELSRRETEKIKKKTAKIRRKNAAGQAHIAEMRAQLAKAHAEQAEIAAQIEALTLDAKTRIDGMMKRLEVGQAQVRVSQNAQAIAALARQDQIRADYAFKATLTSDPILRAAYLARAEGRNLDD